jgi:hypothetical protein
MRKLFAAAVCAALASLPHAAAAAGSPNGIGGAMPAYYDHEIFTINFTELGPMAEKSILSHNPQFNFIFTSEAMLPDGSPFVSVIDAIPADGMNPLWNEVEVTFTSGHTPRQLFSDDEVGAAATSGEVSLHVTDEVYRCSVIGASIPPTLHGAGVRPATTSAATGTSAAPAGLAAPAATTWGALKRLYR